MKKILLQIIYSFVSRIVLKFIVGVRFGDTKFLLKEDRFIIVANHNSHLDTVSLMASIPRKIVHKVKPVAAEDYFGKTKLKARMVSFFVNALLIRRDGNKRGKEHNPIYRMERAIKDGYSLILFPEGTRGEPEKDQKLKPGIGILLSRNPEVKYVPVYMKGMGKAMPKGENLIVPFNSTITYGQPSKIKSDRVEDILNQIEQDFKKLKRKRNI